MRVSVLSLVLLSVPAWAGGPNDPCANGDEVFDGDVYRGDTTEGTVWHRLEGTGGSFVITTCSGFTTFDTVVEVYEGACRKPALIASNDTAPLNQCPDGFTRERSLVEIDTVPGESYLISVAADGTWVGGYGLVISEGPPDVECALTPTGSNNVYDVTSSVAPRLGYDLRQITVYDDNGGSFLQNIIADAEQIVLKPGPNAGRIQDSRDGLVTLTGTRAEFRVLSQWSNTVWGEDQPCVSSVDLGFGRP